MGFKKFKYSAELAVWRRIRGQGGKDHIWSFESFIQVIGPRPTRFHILSRHNAQKPHSLTNSFWKQPKNLSS